LQKESILEGLKEIKVGQTTLHEAVMAKWEQASVSALITKESEP
jgi:hypothetical protein